MTDKKRQVDALEEALCSAHKRRLSNAGPEPRESFRAGVMRSIRSLDARCEESREVLDLGGAIWRSAIAAAACAAVMLVYSSSFEFEFGSTNIELLALDTVEYVITEPFLL